MPVKIPLITKGTKAIKGFFKGSGGQVAAKGAGVGATGLGIGHGIEQAFRGIGQGIERAFRGVQGQEIDKETGEVRHNPLINIFWITLIVGIVLIVLKKVKNIKF